MNVQKTGWFKGEVQCCFMHSGLFTLLTSWILMLSMYRVFQYQKSHFRVRTSFGEFFFSIVALADVNDGGTLYMGISPRRARPCTHRPEQEQDAVLPHKYSRLTWDWVKLCVLSTLQHAKSWLLLTKEKDCKWMLQFYFTDLQSRNTLIQ